MRSVLFYLSIICIIFAVGCDNASKRDTAQGEKSDTSAKLVNDNTSKRRYISVGTAPPGGAFFVVGSAIAEVVGGNTSESGWEVTAEATKGTQENIRRIVTGELEFALANAAISYFAVRGEGAWETEHAIRSVMTLAPNVGLFLTPQSSDVRTIQDFAGKRIVVGPAGAGFEYFLKPILAAHGVTY